MRPESGSQRLLAITRSKAKMFEYGIPLEDHIAIKQDPAELLTLAIGILGDQAASIIRESTAEEAIQDTRKNLQFSAHFFDAYLNSFLRKELDPYLLLLGSASYYLCDLPGSSLVLAKGLSEGQLELDGRGLENLMLWLLQGDLTRYPMGQEGPFNEFIEGISREFLLFFEKGDGHESLFDYEFRLRKTVYDNGTPRQLLFADIIAAIIRKRFENSVWSCLPKYSDVPAEQWLSVFQKDDFVRELWPAQRLIGEHGIFRGKSAIVQIPTSAGKTRAVEFVIRSAFLSGRTTLAVVVAPFRALCHEIRNRFVEAFRGESVSIDAMSDVLQVDFENEPAREEYHILVVTPEKLIYVLRHAPELAASIGLVIYDEGHQFDGGTRGITYELLLTYLKSKLPNKAQTLLLSAIISNATSISTWLNGEEGAVVFGTSLSPTFRTVAFVSWLDRLGRLEFVNPNNPDNVEFFVPRVIEQHKLQLRGRERKPQLFPKKTDSGSIALFLGLKLIRNGSVAIFCGRKTTASSLCEKVIDAYDRGLSLEKPVVFSDEEELERLHYLHSVNLGPDAVPTRSAAIGVFSHHGNTPHGIRVAVEHAMKEGHAKFVICTSTLAQGVNLPIRYLIVASIYQGIERIKVGDFHNLIGRAGRAGMHTEGSILFADPIVYDRKTVSKGKWRWSLYKELLEPKNSEPCASTLLSLFEPIHSDDRKYKLKMDALDIVQTYTASPETMDKLPNEIASNLGNKGFTRDGVARQIAWKTNIISAIESYLLSIWDDSDHGLLDNEITELAQSTLAYFLSDERQRVQITELFRLLASNIERTVPEAPRRTIFGRTMYGVQVSIEVERWVMENIDLLVACKDQDEMLPAIWPLLARFNGNQTFNKCDDPEVLESVAKSWINGSPYSDLFEILTIANVGLRAGKQTRRLKLDHVVDICENAFAYDGTLLLGAVVELIPHIRPEGTDDLVSELQELQKRLKYGLPPGAAIVLYELGFTDRVIAIELARIIEIKTSEKGVVLQRIIQRKDEIVERLNKYPAYFRKRLDDLL